MEGTKQRSSSATKDWTFNVSLEPVHLSEDEDDARIRRLSKKILACVERQRRGTSKKGEADDIFKKDFDEIFGLS